MPLQPGRHLGCMWVAYVLRITLNYFSDDTFLALARPRGIGCNAPEGLAEAFYARKIVF
jgi:hypothetical protein